MSGDLTTIVESGDTSAAMCLQRKTVHVSASSCDDRNSATSVASVCLPSELVNNKQVSSQTTKIFLLNNLSAYVSFFHSSFNKLLLVRRVGQEIFPITWCFCQWAFDQKSLGRSS